jgi:hypothetical protein
MFVFLDWNRAGIEKTGALACITKPNDHSSAAAGSHESTSEQALQIQHGIGT